MAGARTFGAHCSTLSLSFLSFPISVASPHGTPAGKPPGCQISYRADEDTKSECSKKTRRNLYAPFHTWPWKSHSDTSGALLHSFS